MKKLSFSPLSLFFVIILSGLFISVAPLLGASAFAQSVSFDTPATYAVGANPTVGAGSVPSGLAVGDLNGDGVEDLAVSNANRNSVSILLGNPGAPGSFFPANDFPAGGDRPQSVAIGDLDGDGKADLLFANEAPAFPSGDISVLLGDGTGAFTFSSAFPVSGHPRDAFVYDFNGDGRLDVAVAPFGSVTSLQVMLGQGPAGSPPSFGPAQS